MPVVACYCATFLKPEMLHIYRQLTSLQRVRPIVIAQKREEAERYPFEPLVIVRKPAMHFLRRIWYRQLRDAPWQISRGELRTLLGVLDHAKAQLLHIYFGHIAAHLLPLMAAWSRPTVVSFHGADVMVDLDKPAYRAATIRMLSLAKLVLVRSESLGQALRHLGCPPQKIRLQRTGIPVGEIEYRQRGSPRDAAWRFVQACRLIEKKGLMTSLRAFVAFAKDFPAATFTIAGEGPLRLRLGEEAAKLGVSDRVFFTGFVSQAELRQLYYQSHFFLHPSETASDGNQEGVPNSMLEAMASGLPVFATRHGGIPEAIEQDVSGALVAERDDVALAAELLKAARNPESLTRMTTAARRAVEQKFDQAAQTRRLEDLYFEAINLTPADENRSPSVTSSRANPPTDPSQGE